MQPHDEIDSPFYRLMFGGSDGGRFPSRNIIFLYRLWTTATAPSTADHRA